MNYRLEAASSIKVERRRLPDRRRRPTNPFSLRSFRGRRQTIRRKEDRRVRPYVERYGLRMFLFCLFIMLLCVADGLLTVLHVSNGAQELNPFMAHLLQKGQLTFFIVKYVLSAVCVLILVVYKYYPLVRAIMVLLAAVYVAVFLNHLYLIFS